MLPQRAQDPAVRELGRLRAAAAAGNTDPEPAARLIRAYFDLSLARGDPRYIGYAEAVLARFKAPLAPILRVERGLLRQYRRRGDVAPATADSDESGVRLDAWIWH